MADFPGQGLVPLADDRSSLTISTFSGWALGPGPLRSAAVAGAAWPLANRALFVPFRVPVAVTVYKLACGTGTGTTGNFDLGIYDSAGNRIVSTGSTAKSVANAPRVIDVTDTTLLPGLYYLAMATDGTTNYVQAGSGLNLAFSKLLGMRQAASAFALPSTVTYATMANIYIPAVAAYLTPD